MRLSKLCEKGAPRYLAQILHIVHYTKLSNCYVHVADIINLLVCVCVTPWVTVLVGVCHSPLTIMYLL